MSASPDHVDVASESSFDRRTLSGAAVVALFAALAGVARLVQDTVVTWRYGFVTRFLVPAGRAATIQTDSHFGSAQMPKELWLEPPERPGDIGRPGVRVVADWLAQTVAQRTVQREACARLARQAWNWEGCARLHTCWLLGSPS